MQLAAVVEVLVVSLLSGAVAGWLANKMSSPKHYFNDNDHFTTCEMDGVESIASEEPSEKSEQEEVSPSDPESSP